MSNCVKPQQQVRCVQATATSQPDCHNNTVSLGGVLAGGTIVNVPVVLSELSVQINLDSTITLPQPALEIKRIKKRLKVTESMLIQDANKLFLKGFVRKNIEYVTRTCADPVGFCGDVRHCTVDIPFTCVTPVIFNLQLPAPVRLNTEEEFEFFRTQDLSNAVFPEKDQLLNGDFSEFNLIRNEYFNQLPFVELISSRIVEFDEFINRTRPPGIRLPFEELEFEIIEEKMVVDLVIKILQIRQVFVPAVAH